MYDASTGSRASKLNGRLRDNEQSRVAEVERLANMKIAIVGTGGVGGYFGARLAQAGEDVHFIARGKHLEAMRSEGLRVESPLGNVLIRPVRVTADPISIGTADVVLVAVKLWDTEAAARALRPLVGANTAVISLQNGVDKDEVLRRFIEPQNVVGGLCYIAASIGGPGLIQHAGKMARIKFGEFDGARTPRVEAFLKALHAAEVTAELSDDIGREIWEKFVFLIGLSATTALMRSSIGPIRSDPDTREVLLETMDETVRVGIAKGVSLDPKYAYKGLELCDAVPDTMKSSMQVDLSRGNRLELDWLSGAVLRFGRELDVPTPVNRVTYAALKLHAMGTAQ
jgi:2-dehydropantoate 2-reductase